MKKYYLEIKARIFLGSFFKFLEACMEVTLPFLMGTAISYGIAGNPDVWKPLVLLFLFVLFGYCFAFVCQYQASVAQARISARLRGEIYDKTLKVSTKDARDVSTKKMVVLATNDVEKVAMAIAMLIRIVPRTPFIALGSVLMLFVLNTQVAIVFLCVLPFLALLIGKNTKKLIPKTRQNQKVLERISLFGRETAEGILQIHGANLENTISENFEKTARELEDVSKQINKINAFFAPATTLFVNLCVVGVLIFANTLVLKNQVDVAHLSTFVTYMLQLGLAVSVLVNTFNILSRGYTSWGRIGEFIGMENFEEGFVENGELNSENESVLKVENFSLQARGFSLKDISFEMAKGEKIGVVGRTGSGKTLLFEGLLKFLENSGGNVEMFGVNAKDVSQKSILEKFGFVMQKAVIFGGTLDDNLKIGDGEKSDGEFLNRVKQVICPFVIEKENAGETAVMEGGTNLSGGQKQRVSLARMVAKQKSVIILDDSLSALDSETSRNVREFIFENCENVVVLSQKIKDVMHCDKILVLENGELIDMGVHSQLAKSCELYREFCELQGGVS
ncbi:MAG: ABC transporter ATP-binding protein [Bacillota bacterium]